MATTAAKATTPTPECVHRGASTRPASM
jgi:hypothetical protein